jgi:hypothetical protein
MHDVTALIAESEALKAAVHRFRSARPCPLVQGFSLLPITDDFAKELAIQQAQAKPRSPKPIETVSDGVYGLALDISHRCPVAYVSTFYFGGQGGQDALAWDKGQLTFSPSMPGYDQAWPNSPISQALRAIGVVADAGLDAFDTVGLGRHRETHRWADAAT